MASGTIMGSFTGTATGNVRPALEWSSNPNTNGNYSDVTTTLVYLRYNTSWQSWSNNHTVSISIDGNNASASRSFDIRGKSREVVWTRTRRVNHNANGAKSVSLGASGNTGTSLGSFNFSSSVNLDTIPRASTLNSFSIQSPLQVGTANTVNLGLSRASTGFTHDIQLRHGSTVIQSWNGQGVPSTLPISAGSVDTLLGRIRESTTGTVTLRVQTRSGSTNIGEALTRNATVTVHDNVTPNATGLSVTQVGNTVTSQYLQGISSANASFNASATGGAYLISSRIVIRRVSGGTNSSTIHGTSGRSSLLTSNGAYEAIATTTDSRGRSATQRVTFTVVEYSPPRITNFTARRSGSNLTTVNVTWATAHNSLGLNNPLQVFIERRPTGGNWGAILNTTTSIETAGNTLNSTGNAVTSSFEFRMFVSDGFGNTAEATATISTQRVVIDIHKDEGVGIGKLHEEGVLDIGGDARLTEGNFNIEAGGNNLRFTSDGSAFMSWRQQSGTRRGYFGISSGTSTNLTLHNEMGGDVNILGNRLLFNSTEMVAGGSNSNGAWYTFSSGLRIAIRRWTISSSVSNATIDLPTKFNNLT